MMRHICLVFFCLLMAKAGSTQELNLFFDFDKSNLQREEGGKLDQLVQQYKQERFQLVLRGYADTVGNNKYNLDLSKQRGLAVKNYLIANGIGQQDISIEVYGEENAKEDQLFNRRVSVFVSKSDQPAISSYKEIIESITPQKELRAISSSETTTIKGKKGTNVTIPANAFRDRHGKSVTGPVVIEMTEYYSMSDYISKGLSTVSDGKLLVSGGVVDIRAYSDTTELFLKDSMQIKLAFPKSGRKKFSTFYGEPLPDGSMNWKPDKEFLVENDEKTDDVPEIYDPLKIKIITIRRTVEGDKAVIYDPIIKDYRLMTLKDSIALEMDELPLTDKEVQELGTVTESQKKLYNELSSSKLKWINCDYFYKDSSALYVNYYVRIANPGLKAEKAYLIYDDIKAIVQIPFYRDKYRLKGQMPLGRPTRLLVTATTPDGKLFYYFDNIRIVNNKSVKLTLQEIPFDRFSTLVKTI
jgi:hypothetical protein